MRPAFPPIVWIARHADAVRWPLPPAETVDLADGASAKHDGGAGRVLRRRMLRALIGRVFSLHPAAVRFTRSAGGAPGLDGLPAFISTAGCLAEGERWSAIALAPGPIGVDLETGPATDAVVRWTLTEAYVKALGRGLAVPPEQVGVERDPIDAARFRLAVADASGGDGEVLSFSGLVAAMVQAPRARPRPSGPYRAAGGPTAADHR